MKKKRILKYGAIFGAAAGCICLVFFITLYAFNTNPLNIRRPDIGFNIIFIFSAIWYFRKRNKGVLHFYEGFSIGFLVNCIAALISGVGIFIFIQFVDYTPFQTWINEGVKFLENRKDSLNNVLSEENFKLQLISLQAARPYQIIFDELMFKQLAIIAISLISMALRKHPHILTQK